LSSKKAPLCLHHT